MKIPLRRNTRGSAVISLFQSNLNQACGFIVIYRKKKKKEKSTHTSGCNDVIAGANMSELYFVACVLIRYLTSVFVLRKDLHIPHESVFRGEGRYPG